MLPVSVLTNFTICPLLVNVPLMLPELVKSVIVPLLLIFPSMVPMLVKILIVELLPLSILPKIVPALSIVPLVELK